jgi:hypothetical protein
LHVLKLIIMKLKQSITFLFLCGMLHLQAQDQVARQYGNLISEENLRSNLTILASDALEGRETGKRGQKMAASFIKAYFEELGLTGPLNGEYYQPVNLYTSTPKDIYIKAGEHKFVNFQDVVYYGSNITPGEVSLPIVFAGQGSKDDFAQMDVEGKGVVVFVKTIENFRAPVAIAKEKKAKAVFLYSDNVEGFSQIMGQFKNYMGKGVLSLTKPEISSSGIGVFFISPAIAPKLLNTSSDKLSKAANADGKKNAFLKIKPSTIQYQVSMDITTLKTENVLGYLAGTDKKNELLIITAHYDHIGKNTSGEGDLINNGADDDGSGTVTVLELAKVFAKAKDEGKGPRRSILFMTVTGEEKGLLGSDYYTRNPVFPLEKTIVNLNIDMVGRRDAQHKDSAPYVYIIGSDKLSSQLHTISESINKATTNLVFDYTYNDQSHPERLYYRSDHWNFAKNNIPIIFYFDGIHEDYHMPSDEVEKIEFDLLRKRAQVVFFTAWELANRDEKITPDQSIKQ